MNIKRLGIIATLVLFAFVGCGNNEDEVVFDENHQNYKYNIQNEQEVGAIEVIDTYDMNGEVQYMINASDDTLLFPKDAYITYTNDITVEKFDKHSKKQQVSLHAFDIYARDFISGELISSRNIKEIMDTSYTEYQIATLYNAYPYATTIYEGRRCVVILVEEIPEDLHTTYEREVYNLFVSIDDDYYSLDKESKVHDGGYGYKEEHQLLFCTNLFDVNDVNAQITSFSPDTYWEGTPYENTTMIWIDEEMFLEENSDLLTYYPKYSELEAKKFVFGIFSALDETEILQHLTKENQRITFEFDEISKSCTNESDKHYDVYKIFNKYEIRGMAEFYKNFKLPNYNEEIGE